MIFSAAGGVQYVHNLTSQTSTALFLKVTLASMCSAGNPFSECFTEKENIGQTFQEVIKIHSFVAVLINVT